MEANRLEAFSDGVIAIIITVMVLEMKVPHGAESIDGSVLWANLHLLFWLSLLPFTTGWMGENHFAVAFYVLAALIWLVPDQRFPRPITNRRARP